MSKNCAKAKPKIMSHITFNKLFFNNDDMCRNFFLNVFHPLGLVCPECGCVHFTLLKCRNNVYTCSQCSHQVYLFAGTIFQDNKLPLYTLLYGIFLFITSTKGISAEELSRQLGINRKSAQLLCQKMRYLMSLDNDCFDLKSKFIELDGFHIGGKSHNGKRGLGTDKQPFLVALGTDQLNNYPNRIKLLQVKSENKEEVKSLMKHIHYDKDTTICTDGDPAYHYLKDRVHLINGVIDYKESDHLMYWINIQISNIKSNIDGIYHGIAKKYINGYIQEHAWRFNHRYKGFKLMFSMMRIISYSIVMTRKMLKDYYNKASVSDGL